MRLRIIHILTDNGVEFAFLFLILPDGVAFESEEVDVPVFESCGCVEREELPA